MTARLMLVAALLLSGCTDREDPIERCKQQKPPHATAECYEKDARNG